MNIGLFEDDGWQRLLPLTWLRPASFLVCGRDTLLDKLCAAAGAGIARCWMRPAITNVVAERIRLTPPDPEAPWCLVNSRALFAAEVPLPPLGTAWLAQDQLVAVTLDQAAVAELSADLFLAPAALAEWVEVFKQIAPPTAVRLINHPWELPLANPDELVRQCRDGGTREGIVYDGVHLLDAGNICIERGASVKSGAVLDAENGPIHIASGAQVQPNAVIEGPGYIGRDSIVRPGAVVRGGTTLGPVCKVGGEVEMTIFQGFANKQHDGFFGHSYVGEWVNIGADTITSDLKNTYGAVRVFINGHGVESGEQHVGSIIGDHSKTGIGTILPTGCVVGVASNVFVPAGGVPKFVPSFAWLTEQGLTAYRVDKALLIARTVMARREIELTPAEAALLESVSDAAREIEAAGWG